MKDHQQLIEDYLNGDLTDADAFRLRAWLAADADHMRQFIRLAHQHGILHAELHGAEELERFADREQATIKPPRQSPCDKKDKSTLTNVYCFFAQPTPLSLSVAGAVIGLLVISMAFMAPPFYRAMTKSDNDPAADPLRIVAEVTGLHEVQWVDANHSQHRGAFLVPGWSLQLTAGVIEVTYRDGAVVLLEGPCDYVVEDVGRGQLNRGRLLAKVPPQAVGFQVATPATTIIDLGTEFGCEVAVDGVADVAVLEGKVQCRQQAGDNSAGEFLTLTVGQAATFAGTSAGNYRNRADADLAFGNWNRLQTLRSQHFVGRRRISIVAVDTLLLPTRDEGPHTRTLKSFDSSGGDKLVVTVSCETNATLESVTFGGIGLTQVILRINGAQNTSIWYLDNPTGTGDIVTQWDDSTNGTGICAMSLVGTAPGVAATAFNDHGKSTSLTTEQVGTFLVASFVANTGKSSAVAPLAELLSGDIGSATAAVGWQRIVRSGDVSPTFAGPKDRPVIVVATFEPAVAVEEE